MINKVNNTNDLIEVGKIIKPFGIKGEMIAIDYAKDYPTFKKFKKFYIYIEENGISILKQFYVREFRGNSNKIILNLENVETREASEKISKNSLYVLREDIPLQEGEYLFDDLVGCVCYYQGENIGKVIGMPNYGTCDMFEIESNIKPSGKKGKGSCTHVPYFKELIEKIDLKDKIIYFNQSLKDYL
jgi:16S rRNA processing protein RimM